DGGGAGPRDRCEGNRGALDRLDTYVGARHHGVAKHYEGANWNRAVSGDAAQLIRVVIGSGDTEGRLAVDAHSHSTIVGDAPVETGLGGDAGDGRRSTAGLGIAAWRREQKLMERQPARRNGDRAAGYLSSDRIGIASTRPRETVRRTHDGATIRLDLAAGP